MKINDFITIEYKSLNSNAEEILSNCLRWAALNYGQRKANFQQKNIVIVKVVAILTPQYAAKQTACTYDHIKLALEGHSTCPQCGAIPRCR